MTNHKNLDKTKIYVSPSNETIVMYVDGEWKNFIREDVIQSLPETIIGKTLTAEEIAKKYVYCQSDALTDRQEVKDMVADIEELINSRLDVAISQMQSQQSFLSKDNAKVARQAMGWCLDIVEQLKTKES